MVLDLLGMIVTLGDLASVPDVVGNLVCTAAENLPCRPLTLECLFAGVGGLSAGLPAVPPGWGGFPVPDPPREYAPEPPAGHQPPPPQSPQDALNDPEFKRLKDDWARTNADRLYPPGAPQKSRGMSAGDVLVESIRNSNSR
jgi:hypothetical protein